MIIRNFAAPALFRPALALLLAAGVPALAAKKQREETLPVLVNARMVEDAMRKKHPRPTPEKPTYYLPISGGLQQRGPIVAGDTPVGLDEVWTALHKALASQGYQLAEKGGPMPTLLLTFHWGSMNPDRIDEDITLPGEDGDEVIASERILNLREMMALTGGNRMDNFLSMDREIAMERASEERYFVVVTAWDFASAIATPRKKVMVWQSSLSVPSARTTMAASIAPMIAAGAASFGREERLPTEISVPYQKGRVDIGEMQVVDNPKTLPAPAPRRR